MKNKKVIIILIISIVLIGIFSIIVNGNGIIVREKKIIKEMNESTQVTELNSQITKLNKEHEDYLNYIQTCKTKIATALTNEGVTTSDQITLEEMAEKIPDILQSRTSDATATAEDIAEGETAYVNGNKVTGTMKVDTTIYAKLVDTISGNKTSKTKTIDCTSIEGYENLKTDDFFLTDIAIYHFNYKGSSSGDVTYTCKPTLSYDSSTGILTISNMFVGSTTYFYSSLNACKVWVIAGVEKLT